MINKIKGFKKADAAYSSFDELDLEAVEEMNEKSEVIASDLKSYLLNKDLDVHHSQTMIADLGDVLNGNFKVAELLITHKLVLEGTIEAVLLFDYTGTITSEVYSDDAETVHDLLTGFQAATGYDITFYHNS